MEIRTDRVGVLVDQLVDSRDLSADRLAGLTADEYLWEPYDGMWSLRPRAKASTPNAFGRGEWVIDLDTSINPFDAGPLTTVAWRIGHLISGFAGRWEWTFGGRSIEPKGLVEFTPDPEIPFIGIIRWTNREFIHHLAEVALMRDLYAIRAGTDG